MTRTPFLPLAAALLLGGSTVSSPRPSPADLLVHGGLVIDGTGAPRRAADVVIARGRIVAVQPPGAPGLDARDTLDATGLVVAPGFIDPHTHTLGDLSGSDRANLPYLMQGVTTVVTGNDGGGPVHPGPLLDRWTRRGIGTNAALYVGHGTVRGIVLGTQSRAPTASELRRMVGLVEAAMREGALGLSSGLYYAPGSFASTEEVIALARAAAQQGGVYDTHLRDESSYTIGLVAAVDEALRIGREARIPVHLSHIKALGADAWGKADSVIAHVTAARRSGIDVTADQYPYTASGTTLGAALLPRWAEAGGRDSLRRRAADAVTRARLLGDMRENLRRRGGAEAMLLTGSRVPGVAGQRLSELARAPGGDPVEVALDVILAGDAAVASFNMREEDIRRFMAEDWVMTGSDGSTGHPRKYGTYAKLLHDYVFGAAPAMSLEAAVHRSTSLPARALHLAGRGELRPGAWADVIVFDSAAVADRATYEAPERLAVGMRWVIVNGRLAVRDGKPTGVLAGRGLRRSPRPGNT